MPGVSTYSAVQICGATSLNIVDNLVYRCDSCNIIKTNKGLREFCRIREIDFLEVVDRLEKLGKHV